LTQRAHWCGRLEPLACTDLSLPATGDLSWGTRVLRFKPVAFYLG